MSPIAISRKQESAGNGKCRRETPKEICKFLERRGVYPLIFAKSAEEAAEKGDRCDPENERVRK